METAQIKQALQSKRFKNIIGILGIAVLALGVFAIGMEVGYMKAGFSYKFGESYYRSFGEEGAHPMGLVPGDVSDAHGVNGTIVSVSLPTLVIADQDQTEKVVKIGDDTIIRELRGTIAPSDLKVGDSIVILGNPDSDSDIDAKFIRVIPAQAPSAPAQAATPAPQAN